MANYGVNRNPQTNGDHEVHNLDAQCPYEPAASNRESLGKHSDCRTAVAAAKRYYRQSNGCAHCARACHIG